MQPLQLLTRYKRWANQTLYTRLAQLPGDLLTKPQPIVFGSLLRTLNHVRIADEVWKAHLLGHSHGYSSRNPEACPDFDDLRELQRGLDAWFLEYVVSLDAHASAQPVRFEFIGGGAGELTRREILLHVGNHGTYHRGHVADMLYQMGFEPPTTDLPVFLRERAAGQEALEK